MLFHRATLGLLLALPAVTATVTAAPEVALAPTLMTARGRLLLREDFDRPVVLASANAIFQGVLGVVDRDPRFVQRADGWLLHPGKWTFVDGAISGTQAERHGPVAAYAIPLGDAVIQFDVQFNGSRQTMFRLNDTVDHVCRVIVTPEGFAAQKDDHDHDGPDQAVPFGKVALPIRTGEWKTVLLEICGTDLVASIDGKHVVGTNPLLAEPKATVAFVVSGSSARFRNLRIWEAKSKPDWPAQRDRHLASPPKAP